MSVQITENTLIAFIRLILIQVWDPIGVKRFGIIHDPVVSDDSNGDGDMIMVPLAPMEHRKTSQFDMENEYDSYVPTLYAMVIDRRPVADFYRHLRYLERELMEVTVDDVITRNAAGRLYMIGKGIVASTNQTGA